MVENLIKNYNNSDNNEFNSYIEGLNLKGLVNFYLKCSNHLYFKKYNNINEILEVVFNNIKQKYNSVSILELIDIYTNIFTETLNVEESIESNNNIIDVRKMNLEDNFFIEYETKKNNLERSDFIDKYTRSLDYYEENALYLKTVFSFIDKLQQEIVDYLDDVISKLSNEEKHVLLIKINEIIEKNYQEIIERNEIRKNRKTIDIHSKMKEIPTFEIFNMLDTSMLKNKNYVYSSFQSMLKQVNYSSKK